MFFYGYFDWLKGDAFQRMKELQSSENGKKMLRLSVEAGGCSGFQYAFALDDNKNNDGRYCGISSFGFLVAWEW